MHHFFYNNPAPKLYQRTTLAIFKNKISFYTFVFSSLAERDKMILHCTVYNNV